MTRPTFSIRGLVRNRPVWGALLLILAALDIAHFAGQAMIVSVTTNGTSGAGYTLAGGLLLCALVAVISPRNTIVMGLFAIAISLAAFVLTNLGGMLVGSVLGILGGSMLSAWGPVTRGRVKEAHP